jgi:uncharacterized membrane protein
VRTGLELLDVALRWLHVIAAIMWVGNSLLFNWLDRTLRPAAAPRPRSIGESWLLHGGGFYQVEKTLAPGDVALDDVHWFKWQAYTTWLSGAALLIVVYYATGGALLVNPDAGVSPRAAAAIGVGVLLAGWLAYDALWRSPLGRRAPLPTIALCFVLLLVLGHVLAQVFTGRAAFLHIGALLGTLMAGNVRFHIMTAQRAFVAGIASGEPGDERLSSAAKLRSIHNNYMTFPVIVLMMSAHFPALYAAPQSWAVLGVLLLGGAGIRHILNIRWSFAAWQPALAGTMAATLVALWALTLPPARTISTSDDDTPVDFAEVFAIVQKRCTVCHSMSPADRTFGAPAGAVAFDTPDQVRAMAARIEARTVLTQTMPPANQTWMTPQERMLIARWALRAHRPDAARP